MSVEAAAADADGSPFPAGAGVRPAVPADAEQLVGLEREARASLVESRGGPALLDEQPAVGDWSLVVGRPGTHVMVAEIDGVLVGYLELHHESGTPTGVVRQVYVQPEARELGFGDELLAQAMTSIRRHGGVRVESFALPGDRDTKNLFERAGVTARKIIVSRRLDD